MMELLIHLTNDRVETVLIIYFIMLLNNVIECVLLH